MIKTNKGEIEMKGNGAEIAADLVTILDTAFEEFTLSLVIALEEFEKRANAKADEAEKETETKIRLEAFAAMLSHLPEEELEALKKRAEEGQNDGKV